MSDVSWENELDPDRDDVCPECDGEGGFHDCGEDTCCCLYHDGEPEDVDWFVCPYCGGNG